MFDRSVDNIHTRSIVIFAYTWYRPRISYAVLIRSIHSRSRNGSQVPKEFCSHIIFIQIVRSDKKRAAKWKENAPIQPDDNWRTSIVNNSNVYMLFWRYLEATRTQRIAHITVCCERGCMLQQRWKACLHSTHSQNLFLFALALWFCTQAMNMWRKVFRHNHNRLLIP